jgi:hypothetical protein
LAQLFCRQRLTVLAFDPRPAPSRATNRSRAATLETEICGQKAPELNDIEVVWHDLKAHHLAHHTFADADALDQPIHQAVDALNAERTVLPLAKRRISATKTRNGQWGHAG